MKVKELEGTALDWAVAQIVFPEWIEEQYNKGKPSDLMFDDGEYFLPSTDWGQGGPIIEREFIALGYGPNDGWIGMDMDGNYYFGPTPLIAAMRCFVATHLGAETEIPEDLLI